MNIDEEAYTGTVTVKKGIITMEKQSMNLTYQTQVFAQRVLSLKGNVALRVALGLDKKG